MRYLTVAVLLSGSLNSYAGQLLTAEQQLGERLFSDENLSLNKNQACASCHSLSPAHAKSLVTKLVPGFVDPDNVKSGSAVSEGSIRGLTGSLNAPSVGYAAYSPEFHWHQEVDEDGNDAGLYIGGQFWDGRASSLSDQAKMPFLNPVEMAMPNDLAVVNRLKQDKTYQRLFREVYGLNLNQINSSGKSNTRQSAPTQSATVEQIFAAAAKAIGEYEQTQEFNKFNSKFDYVLAGKTSFSPLEAKGFELFNNPDKGNCAACHISEATVSEDGSIEPPLFTDFSYDNIGLPRNINIPGNPEPNPGLGGRTDLTTAAADELGKHKVMSLRNIALTAPYGHNGSMATLEQIVHFYNTRDTLGYVEDINQPGFGITGWPTPELISDTLNQEELGNLGLTDPEEKAIVAFLMTLTDDYPKWGHDRRVPSWSPAPFAQPVKSNKGKHFKARLRRILSKKR
ncbi:methylamine utilization protein MauG [Methylomonas lenta]|uniref:Methylamine utilization protein MauG n=1 Tax=Methylomonas lenta TaxID=980561 RepID=A0A177NSZ1_9GAMM|nr:cytochrome c peroxidase [Methylomonas lenta]OAI21178.1 methylamine utilization protein MauG [Methylomonas lenta]